MSCTLTLNQTTIADQLRQSGIQALTLIDWLAYMPLFLAVHSKVVSNPLEDWV